MCCVGGGERGACRGCCVGGGERGCCVGGGGRVASTAGVSATAPSRTLLPRPRARPPFLSSPISVKVCDSCPSATGAPWSCAVDAPPLLSSPNTPNAFDNSPRPTGPIAAAAVPLALPDLLILCLLLLFLLSSLLISNADTRFPALALPPSSSRGGDIPVSISLTLASTTPSLRHRLNCWRSALVPASKPAGIGICDAGSGNNNEPPPTATILPLPSPVIEPLPVPLTEVVA
jgi:hypothetical protein